MAVTKLMHIKSSPHGAGRHLYNSIAYIVNPKKTNGGLWVGGNAGTEPGEIYEIMRQTKTDWGKPDGRQGYHFVLSWKPGETTPDQAMDMIKEFCEIYLGDSYDYVFSVHDDHDHMHGHIVFNSVSRTTGYKYRYEKGDWEKQIQPITDEICERHGLNKLEYDKNKKLGKSYAEHYAEKNGGYTWKKIIQADIDYMISCSDSWEDFQAQMKMIGYSFPRSGVKRGVGEYITFCAPGGHKRRSDSLGDGYSVADIKERISQQTADRKPERNRTCMSSPRLKKFRMASYQKRMPLSGYQAKSVGRYLRASTYFSRSNPFAVYRGDVRRDLLQIDRLRQDCQYILRNNVRSEAELDHREEVIKNEEKYLRSRKAEAALTEDDEKIDLYLELNQKLAETTDPNDDSFEELQDQINELERQLPQGIEELLKDRQDSGKRLKELLEEKKIIRHIKRSMSEQTEMKTHQMTVKKAAGKMKAPWKGSEKIWKQR